LRHDVWMATLKGSPYAQMDGVRGPDGVRRATLSGSPGAPIGVIISDTFGRPWREGVVNVALGVAGLRPLVDYRGCRDPYGRELHSTVIAVADEIASAAEMVMRKITRTPVAVVRGAGEWLGKGSSSQLIRPASRDLFR